MADTVLFTEVWTGTSGAWPGTWTISSTGSGTTATLYQNQGYLYTPTSGTGIRANPTAVGNNEDAEILVTIAREGTSTNTNIITVSPVSDLPAYTSGAWAFQNAVWMEASAKSGNNNVTLKAARNGTVVSTTVTYTWAAGAKARVRFRKEGTTVYFRIWNPTGSEPGTWNATWDISANAPVAGGTKKMMLANGQPTGSAFNGDVYYDDLTFTGVVANVSVNPVATAGTGTGLAVQPAFSQHRIYPQTSGVATGLSVDPVVSAVKNPNHNASAGTASALMPNPVVVARPLQLFTNFDDTVNPFTLDQTGTALANTSTGDLVFSGLGNATRKLTLTGFTFEVGGEILYRVSSTNAMNVNPYFGASNVTVTTTGDMWVRARHNGTQIQYRKWAAGTVEPTSWTTLGTTNAAGSSLAGGLNVQGTASAGTFMGATVSFFSANEAGTTRFPDIAVDGSVATANATMVNPVVSASTGVNVAATPCIGSGLLADPAVLAGSGYRHTATAATGSAAAVQPVVVPEFNPDANVAVTAATGSALGPQGSYSAPVVVLASAATASGAAVSADALTERNAVVRPGVATSVGVFMDPDEARNVNNDPYYQRVRSTTTESAFWYRMDETSGSVLHAIEGHTGNPRTENDADLFGTVSFNVYGPEGRKAIHFTDGYAQRRVPTGKTYIDDFDSEEFTFETVIRTWDGNGMLAYGIDRNNPLVEGPFGATVNRNSVYLKDGKVALNRNRGLNSNNAQGQILNEEWVGIKNVADGQWHHIVVTVGGGNPNELDNGLRIYIDGKLDIRRRAEIIPKSWASPDSYFGMPDAWRNEVLLYPWQKNFNGDVMEVVFRYSSDITIDTAIELNYAAFGIVPIRVTPATATGVMPEAKGKGNQKRALMLYVSRPAAGTGVFNSTRTAVEQTNASGGIFDGDFDFGPTVPIDGAGINAGFDMGDYRVFSKEIVGEYRDYVTDQVRLLDLTTDVPNIDQYDLIFFRNWPDESNEIDVINSYGPVWTRDTVADFLESLRTVVDGGMSLWVSHPALAQQLGIVSTVELVDTMLERRNDRSQGDNQVGHYDPRAADVDVWVDQTAFSYWDTHRNNRERIVASVDGLTTIPGSVVSDYFISNPRENIRVDNLYSIKFEDRPNGLLIGDEYVETTQFFNDVYRPGFGGATQYMFKTYGVPSWAVLAGTIVTKFGAKVWDGNTEIDNPYKDYAGTIVLKPGDSLKGRPVGGKVLVTLDGDPRFGAFGFVSDWQRQIVPSNSLIVNPLDRESDDQRAWDYSTYRWLIGGGSGGSASNQKFQFNPDGTISVFNVSTGTPGPINIAEKYPTEPVKVPSMIQRGLAWLSERVFTAPGDVVIRTGAFSGNGNMLSQSIYTQRSVSVSAQAAVAIGQAHNPAQVVDPDAHILVLPATGSGVLVQYEKKIVVEPFTGSATMTEITEVAAARDTIVVYLLRPTSIILNRIEEK